MFLYLNLALCNLTGCWPGVTLAYPREVHVKIEMDGFLRLCHYIWGGVLKKMLKQMGSPEILAEKRVHAEKV